MESSNGFFIENTTNFEIEAHGLGRTIRFPCVNSEGRLTKMTAPSRDRSRSFPLSSTSCARRRASPADTNGLPDPNVSPWRSCIDAYVCYQSKQTFILEHFSRSTRFVHFGPQLGFQFFHRSKLSVQSKKMAKFGDKELIW